MSLEVKYQFLIEVMKEIAMYQEENATMYQFLIEVMKAVVAFGIILGLKYQFLIEVMKESAKFKKAKGQMVSIPYRGNESRSSMDASRQITDVSIPYRGNERGYHENFKKDPGVSINSL